jgi:DNA recombination protein RmuC
VLAKVKSQTQTVLNSIDSAETRTRAMGRALRQVEALSDSGADTLLAGNSAADADESPAQGPLGAP